MLKPKVHLNHDKINYGLVGLIISFNFSANLGNDIYLPSITHLSTVFNVTPNIMLLSMTVWFVGVAFPQLIFGPLSDRFGRKPVLFGGSISFIIATIICGLSPNITIFFIARFFQGVGVCCINVTSNSIFSELYDSKTLRKIISIMNLICSLSPIVGPVIGGYLFTFFGWRINFIFVAGFSCCCFIGLYFKHLELLHIKYTESLTFRSAMDNYKLILKNKVFLKSIIPYCLILGGLVTYITAAPFIFISELKMSPQQFSYVQALVFLFYIVGSMISFFSGGEPNRSEILLNMGLFLIVFSGITMLIFVIFTQAYFVTVVYCMMLYVLGLSLCAPKFISTIVLSNLDLRGYTSALLGFSMSISCVTLGLVLSMIYNGILSFVILLLLVSITACVTFFAIDEK